MATEKTIEPGVYKMNISPEFRQVISKPPLKVPVQVDIELTTLIVYTGQIITHEYTDTLGVKNVEEKLVCRYLNTGINDKHFFTIQAKNLVQPQQVNIYLQDLHKKYRHDEKQQQTIKGNS